MNYFNLFKTYIHYKLPNKEVTQEDYAQCRHQWNQSFRSNPQTFFRSFLDWSIYAHKFKDK